MNIRTLHPRTQPRSVIPNLIVSFLSSWYESNLLKLIFDFAESSFCRNSLLNKQIYCFRSIGAQFVMCSRVPCPLDSSLSIAMQKGETLKTYSDRYWEMFNEIDEDFEDVAIRTFNVGLPTEHDLRRSLTMKPMRSMRQLMDRIDEYKQVKKDQQQGKGKAKATPLTKETLGQRVIIAINPEEILLDILGILLPK